MLADSEDRALRRRQKRAVADLEQVEEQELNLQKRFKSAQERYNTRLRV